MFRSRQSLKHLSVTHMLKPAQQCPLLKQTVFPFKGKTHITAASAFPNW